MTKKQEIWRKRVRILWRLKGMHIPYDKECLTPEELSKLNQANSIIREVVDNFTQSSISLGFKAVKRCVICGKPAMDNSDYCAKHIYLNDIRR